MKRTKKTTNMLIEFAVTNFRSFKNRELFSMLPSSRVKERKNTLHKLEAYPNLEVLPVAVIFGKNAAGKSNLLRAMRALSWLITNSHKFSVGDSLKPNEQFAFDSQSEQNSTTFEIDFVADNQVRYNFIVELNSTCILREELHYYRISKTGKTTRRKLYIRNKGKDIDFSDDFKGIKKPIEERLIENMLFLSKAVQENNAELRPVFNYFKTFFKVIDLTNEYVDFQNRYFGQLYSEEKGAYKLDKLNTALKNIDSGILHLKIIKSESLPTNIKIEELNDDSLSTEEKIKKDQVLNKILDILKFEIHAYHRSFDGTKEIEPKSISLSEESEGTRKFIAAYSKILELLENGGVFIVDELERSLHPLLTQALIKILMTSRGNSKNAQLIFTSHDTSLIDILDWDQINILEKDEFGATEIYTISDIKGLRNDIPLQKWYMSGKFAGIPNINLYTITQSLENFYGKNKENR